MFTPGRYLGIEEVEGDGVSFEGKGLTITSNLKQQFEKSVEHQKRIKDNLKKAGIDNWKYGRGLNTHR